MNGGIVQPSTEIFTSLRDKLTLKTPSLVLRAPLSPMICSIFAVSSFCAFAEAQSKTTRQNRCGVGLWIHGVEAKSKVQCFKLKYLLHSIICRPCCSSKWLLLLYGLPTKKALRESALATVKKCGALPIDICLSATRQTGALRAAAVAGAGIPRQRRQK